MQNTLAVASQVAMIALALMAFIYSLDYAKVIVAPVFLGVVIGLMFSPVATRLERIGLPSWLSALIIMVLFVLLVIAAAVAFSVPLSAWIERAPQIWEALKLEIASWRDLFTSVAAFQQQLTEIAGQAGAMTVNVADEGALGGMATLAPAIVAQTLLFFVSLYFFVATRQQLRVAILRLCMTRRVRLRTARFFREVEYLIARYLLTITAVNIAMGAAVAVALWLLGVPSPLLWGSLAIVLNYVIYVGPAIMALILFGVSLATGEGGLGVLLPSAVYLCINLVESEFVTNQALGVTMTINPFAIFLALTFWLWLWGPIGGFIAVPSLLILQALVRTLLPLSKGQQARTGFAQ
ncbi:AI-2E family transporter [Ciceribacter sp. L1K23]|uniref:AI-2E family transporter n=1 Tax=Ciceribacter sp. L1K23 TaxID=2820276 RepID=UPI001B815231|nr:AI-2E family transporter [Ciceribacter sp. L1K23]MBR0557335.1 AI-2E family transporter [Ciceribacter sp. L1K23]